MKSVELSEHIRLSYPASKRSLTMRRAVYGIGINDAEYSTPPFINGKQVRCPAYIDWCGMLRRAYSDKYHNVQPTYSNINVCDKWLSFSRFRSWWVLNVVDGWALDKDLILPGSNLYSESTCVYVPQRINNFLSDNRSRRGEYPIGASFNKPQRRFIAACWDFTLGKQVKIGAYDSPLKASAAWVKFKKRIAESMKPELDSIDPRLFNSVILKIDELSSGHQLTNEATNA